MIGEFKPYKSKQTGNIYPNKCYYSRLINGFYVPCGKCEFCRRTKANEWSFRLEEHGFDKYIYNCLLTYEDSHLSYHKGKPSVNKVHCQEFLKRFRYYIKKYYGAKITFFLCAEYGGKRKRPHCHLLVFSEVPLHKQSADPFEFINSILAYSWKHGYADIELINSVGGSVNYLTSYMISYNDCMEYDQFNKPFLLMSRCGLGKSWIDRHPNQVKKMREDMDYSTVVNGYKHPLPRYLRRKIMPQEQVDAQADAFYHYSKTFNKEVLKPILNTKEKIKNYYENKRNDRKYQHEREFDAYRKGKIHANNSNSSQLSRRIASAKKFEAIERASK